MDYDEKMNEGRAYMMAAGRRIREVYTYNTALGFVMYALCEDGTLWSRSPFNQDGNAGWDAVPPIPGSLQAIEEAALRFKAAAEELVSSDPSLAAGYEHPEK